MQRFAQLIEELNNTTKTNDKRDALVAYFREAPEEDRLWLVALFTGRRPKRLVNSTLLKEWCMDAADIRPWLFDECYHTVGDLGEAIALMLPAQAFTPDTAHATHDISLSGMMKELQKLQTAIEEEKHRFILHEWQTLSKGACLVFNK